MPADSRDELRAAAETVVAMRRTLGRLTPGVLDDLERSLATPAPTASLDAAFGEVESLLPEGWKFYRLELGETTDEWEASVCRTVEPGRRWDFREGTGPTALAALLALASRLHNEEPGQ